MKISNLSVLSPKAPLTTTGTRFSIFYPRPAMKLGSRNRLWARRFSRLRVFAFQSELEIGPWDFSGCWMLEFGVFLCASALRGPIHFCPSFSLFPKTNGPIHTSPLWWLLNVSAPPWFDSSFLPYFSASFLRLLCPGPTVRFIPAQANGLGSPNHKPRRPSACVISSTLVPRSTPWSTVVPRRIYANQQGIPFPN